MVFQQSSSFGYLNILYICHTNTDGLATFIKFEHNSSHLMQIKNSKFLCLNYLSVLIRLFFFDDSEKFSRILQVGPQCQLWKHYIVCRNTKIRSTQSGVAEENNILYSKPLREMSNGVLGKSFKKILPRNVQVWKDNISCTGHEGCRTVYSPIIIPTENTVSVLNHSGYF